MPLEIPRPQFAVAESVLSGETTDIYFVRTKEILKREDLNPVATMEVFPRSEGILCGMQGSPRPAFAGAYRARLHMP